MDWHVHSELPMVLACIGTVISLLLTAALPPSLSQSPPSNHSLCKHPYECGEYKLYYPFWGEDRPVQCGGDKKLKLSCGTESGKYGGEIDYAYIETDSQRFKVVGNDDPLNTTFTLVPLPVADGEHDVCSMNFNYSLNYLPFTYNQIVHNITIFYDCTYSRDYQSLGCGGSGGDVVYYNGTEKEVLASHQELKDCQHRIQVAAEAVELNGVGVDDAFPLYFGKGVSVSYTYSQDCMRCVDSGGSCGRNDTHAFTCYCPDGSIALPCSHPVPAPDPPPGPRANYRSQEKSATAAAVIAGLLSICYFTYMSPASQEKYCFPTKVKPLREASILRSADGMCRKDESESRSATSGTNMGTIMRLECNFKDHFEAYLVHNITIFYNCTYFYPDNHSLGCGDVVYYNGTEKEGLASHQGYVCF
ncbi:hypothetical protein Ahy_A05g022983 isoform B [Arachis hypogaea]|uniref:Wall-associated receptor kinase C-terminal domain-containing protein n=1 Tax=Arachis hypogaea TaxID=3818 RepID=A0A445D224_ARAHY|nr:hypothetical protein Ahy_A05g022983 isoform B [Arachis hypogaea]